MQESLQQQNLKKEEANCIYQHYKGQEKKLSQNIITEKNQRKRCSKNSSENDFQKNDFKDKDKTTA